MKKGQTNVSEESSDSSYLLTTVSENTVWYVTQRPCRQGFAPQGVLQLIVESPSSQCLHIELANRRDRRSIMHKVKSLLLHSTPPDFLLMSCHRGYMELLQHMIRTRSLLLPLWSDAFDDATPVQACISSFDSYLEGTPPHFADGISSFNGMCREWQQMHNDSLAVLQPTSGNIRALFTERPAKSNSKD